jgi:hypothetical protein
MRQKMLQQRQARQRAAVQARNLPASSLSDLVVQKSFSADRPNLAAKERLLRKVDEANKKVVFDSEISDDSHSEPEVIAKTTQEGLFESLRRIRMLASPSRALKKFSSFKTTQDSK